MSSKIKQAVADYYTDKLRKFGTTPKGVDWNSEESQALRFLQLCKVLPDQPPFSLLDYGCGYGALYNFLLEADSNFSYTGYDVSEEMISTCKSKFATTDAKWLTDDSRLVPHDFTIASGIFNVKMEFLKEEWIDYTLKTLQTINKLSMKGFSFNILTAYSGKEFMKDNLFYADPCFFFDYCKRNFSRQVALLHDYQLFEFSIIVRK